MSDDTTIRPILFSGPMIQALLEGRKTQTRRVAKPQPIDVDSAGRWYQMPSGGRSLNCYDIPYGQAGDLLWVRETWRVGALDCDYRSMCIDYRADNSAHRKWLTCPDDEMFDRLWEQSMDDAEAAQLPIDVLGGYSWEPGQAPTRLRPSIHMPRWASRLTLRITDVRIERLQEISKHDALAEGITEVDFQPDDGFPWCTGYMVGADDGRTPLETTATAAYQELWDSLNEKRGYGWDANPWVWALTFEVIKTNVDDVMREDNKL